MLLSLQTGELAAKSFKRSASSQDCAELIKLVAVGDESAFAALYNRTSGLIFGLLLRNLGHSQTAEKALTQVYAEIRAQAHSFDETRVRPLTWLIVIVHRCGIAWQQQQEAAEKHFETYVQNEANNGLPRDFDSEAIFSKHERFVAATMNSFSPAQTKLIELAYLSGMKESEIAEYLGEPPEIVNFGLNSAMKKLSALFGSLNL